MRIGLTRVTVNGMLGLGVFFSLFVSVWNIPAFAQSVLTQPDLTNSPYYTQGTAHTPPSNAAPHQTRPSQVPPKSINGVAVNTHIYGQTTQSGHESQPSLPGHPGLTALQMQREQDQHAVRVAMNETVPTVAAPQLHPQPQPATPNPQYANAVQDPRLAYPAAGTASPPLIGPGQYSAPETHPVQQAHPQQTLPVQIQSGVEPRVHLSPFPALAPEEAAELDAVLDRWEQNSAKVDRLDMDFKLYYWDGGATIGHFDPNQPTYVAEGTFNFVAPNRVLYEVQAASYAINWIDKDGKSQSMSRTSQPEKWLYDGKAILEYRADDKKVLEYPIPPDQQGKGLAESPLPLVFGAKKEDMKNRYWMRLVTDPEWKDKQVWIELFPRWSGDRMEFVRIEMRLDAKTLAPVAMRKEESNGKTKVDYAFIVKKPAVLDLGRWVRERFTRDVPSGWTKEIVRYEVRSEPAEAATTRPLIPQTSGAPQPAPASDDPNGTTLYDPEAVRQNVIRR